MQIHRSAHTRAFTVISNAALQDNRLSFVARGVLGYLLSRFDGERVDVRKLAGLCKTGRQQVANALTELKACGYYEVVREQDPHTGRFITRTFVYETPGERRAQPPAARKPDAGEPGADEPGIPPTGVSTEGQVPPTPVELPEADAALLRRIECLDPRLRIGTQEAASLLPLFAQWRERGVAEGTLAQVLTAGLPPQVHAPAKLLASRLVRKLPPQPIAALRARHECAECGRPLAGGAQYDTCAPCRGVSVVEDGPGPEIAQSGRARVREALALAGSRTGP